MKKEVINIRAFHVTVQLNNNFSVTVSFLGERINSRAHNRSEINITFEWYFLRFINRLFQGLAKQAQARIDDSGFNGKGE